VVGEQERSQPSAHRPDPPARETRAEQPSAPVKPVTHDSAGPVLGNTPGETEAQDLFRQPSSEHPRANLIEATGPPMQEETIDNAPGQDPEVASPGLQAGAERPGNPFGRRNRR
jgi:hypothetical protein